VLVFQIFVSSTFRDLSAVREVISGSLNLRDSLDVVGMEGFIPSEKTSQETCIRELNKCQIYLLLIGDRYGTKIEECGITESVRCCKKDPGDDCENIISYTRCEYENAVGRNMAIMAIFVDDKLIKDGEKVGKETRENVKLFEEFKDEIEKIETCKHLEIRGKTSGSGFLITSW